MVKIYLDSKNLANIWKQNINFKRKTHGQTHNYRKEKHRNIKIACMFQHLKGKMHINVLFGKVIKKSKIGWKK